MLVTVMFGSMDSNCEMISRISCLSDYVPVCFYGYLIIRCLLT